MVLKVLHMFVNCICYAVLVHRTEISSRTSPFENNDTMYCDSNRNQAFTYEHCGIKYCSFY